MLSQKLNNPQRMFTKLNNNTSLFTKQTMPQTQHMHHQPTHQEEKYRNDLELYSKRK